MQHATCSCQHWRLCLSFQVYTHDVDGASLEQKGSQLCGLATALPIWRLCSVSRCNALSTAAYDPTPSLFLRTPARGDDGTVEDVTVPRMAKRSIVTPIATPNEDGAAARKLPLGWPCP